MPAEAEAPPDLVTPLTASPAPPRAARARFERVDRRQVGIEQIEIGKVAREQRRIGEAGKTVLGRGARHGDGALGQRVEPSRREIVGGDHRLPAADQHAQADSSPSARSDSSTAPSRTSTDSDTERTATASAARRRRGARPRPDVRRARSGRIGREGRTSEVAIRLGAGCGR